MFVETISVGVGEYHQAFI